MSQAYNYTSDVEQEDEESKLATSRVRDGGEEEEDEDKIDVLHVLYYIYSAAAIIYLAIIVAYLCQVVFGANFLYGYYRPELKPGPFTNDRGNWIWVFLILSMLKCPIPVLILFAFQNPRVNFPRTALFQMLNIIFWLDLFILIVIFIMKCWFCNNCGYRNGICDAPLEDYCSACWIKQPDVCIPKDTSPTNPNHLPISETYYYWRNYTIIWLVMDFLMSRGLIYVTQFLKYDLYQNMNY